MTKRNIFFLFIIKLGILFRKELANMLKTQEPPPSLHRHSASIPVPTRNSSMKCAYHQRVKSLRKPKR